MGTDIWLHELQFKEGWYLSKYIDWCLKLFIECMCIFILFFKFSILYMICMYVYCFSISCHISASPWQDIFTMLVQLCCSAGRGRNLEHDWEAGGGGEEGRSQQKSGMIHLRLVIRVFFWERWLLEVPMANSRHLFITHFRDHRPKNEVTEVDQALST